MAGAAGPGSGRLLPLELGRLLPLAVGRLLLPPGDAAPLRGSDVAAALSPGPPPPGSLLPVGPSSGGARPTRLFRGTVTLTLMRMPAGRGRCPVAEGVHHGLVDPTRPLKAPRSPSRGTPSGSSLPWPAPAVTSISESSWEVRELVEVTGEGVRAGELSPPACLSARSAETPWAGWLKAAIWLVRSTDRDIAVMASARS